MTSGRFSDDAKTVARSNHISLIDGEMLLTLIERLPGGARQQLLAFATAGDYRTPTCPGCGAAMRHVAGKGGRPDFWGCPGYPRCKQILRMRQKRWRQLEPALIDDEQLGAGFGMGQMRFSVVGDLIAEAGRQGEAAAVRQRGVQHPPDTAGCGL